MRETIRHILQNQLVVLVGLVKRLINKTGLPKIILEQPRSSPDLQQLAGHLLEEYKSSPWIDPILIPVDIDEDRTVLKLEANTPADTPFPAQLTFQELITIFRNPDRTTGQTIFVVGGAAQGKSRLATEVAAALLRADRPCVFLRRRELDAFRDVNDPQELALKYVREHYADRFRDLVSQRTLPFIIDGWNEIEELYSQHRVYSLLIEIISGAHPFPALVTSRRLWWQDDNDRSFVRQKPRTYRLESFDDARRDLFVENHGLDPITFSKALEASGLDAICRRPFFLEQAIALRRSDVELPPTRSELVLRSEMLRFKRVRSAALQKSYQSWPQAEDLCVASALAATADHNGEINRRVVCDLLARHFEDSVPIQNVFGAYANLGLLDSVREETPDVFLHPHATLRDFGLAVAWRDRNLPLFAFLPDYDDVAGYWVGLQQDANAAVRVVLDHPHTPDRPAVLVDVLYANMPRLTEECRREIWRDVGKALCGRRTVRNAAVRAIRELPAYMRAAGIASGLLQATRSRWPEIFEIARHFVTNPYLDEATWQALTREGMRRQRRLSRTDQVLSKPRHERAGIAMVSKSKKRRKEPEQHERMRKIDKELRKNSQATVDKLFQDLQDQAKTELVRKDAARALGELRITDTVPRLRELLSNAVPSACALAAKALGHLGDWKSVPQLRALLSNPDPDVRHGSVTALGRIGDLSVWPDIEQRLSDLKEPPKVRGAAATALGRLRARGAIRALITALTDDNDVVRGSAIKALGLTGDPNVRALIEERLSNDNDEQNRTAAATALEGLGDREAVPALLTALKDDDVPEVRSAAARVLGLLGDS